MRKNANQSVSSWLRFALAVLVGIGGIFFFLGQLSSKATSLERLVKGHDKIIQELTSTTSTLSNVVEGHYVTMQKDIDTLKEDIYSLRLEIRETRQTIENLQK
jgi:predicted RNase H-like nuclease (RuvC/YqgF family)